MELKKYFEDSFNEAVIGFEEELNEAKDVLVALKDVNFDNAEYYVKVGPDNPLTVISRGDDPAKRVEVVCTGSIKAAINAAEREYEQVNAGEVGDSVTYNIGVKLGGEFYEIPTEFWEEHMKYKSTFQGLHDTLVI